MKDLNKVTILKGKSGKKYTFSLFSFDNFEELSDELNEEKGALYLFTKRNLKNGKYVHDYIYLGETSDISTRYGNHHKRRCIMSYGSNCIGFFFTDKDEDDRKAMENDILEANDFPCNDINN